MSVRVYDFRCEQGHVSEMFVDHSRLSMRCTTCNDTAWRQLAAPRAQLEPFTGSFPGAAAAWVKRREQRMAQERKHERDHGTTWIGQSKSDE